MRTHVNIYALRIPKVVMDIFKDVKKDCFQVVRRRCVVCFGTRVNQCMYKDFHQLIATKHRSNNGQFFAQGRKTRPTIALPIHLAFLEPLRTQCMYVMFPLITYKVFVWKIFTNLFDESGWTGNASKLSSPVGYFVFKITWIPNGSIKVSINTYLFYFL